MKRVIRRLVDVRSWLRRGRVASPSLPSLVRAMDDLVPRRVMREVVASSHDRRQWGVLAAAWVGVSEREFFSAAASKMGIPLEDRVLPVDLTVFGDQARPLLSELRRVGAIVSLQGLSVTKVMAVDPAEIRGLSVYQEGVPVSLASWSDIARALDAAERIILEYENNTEAREAKQRHEVCAKILNIIVKEAAAHGASTVEVITSDGKTRYQFSTSHGRTATGTIRSEVVQELLKYLCTLEGSIVKTEVQGDVILRSLGNSSNFRLSWGDRRAIAEFPRDEDASTAIRDVHHSPALPLPAPPDLSRSGNGAETLSANHDEVREVSGDHPVLVVDDNPMFCRVLERLLKREGVSPYFAENGVVALEKLAASPNLLPKVIICDLHMPVMNGRELLARLKEDTRLRSIPIIMLTSDDDVDAELQLLGSGADAFVSKAKDPRVLTAQVQRALKQASIREAA